MPNHKKLKALMKERGLNFHDIARITGHSYQSVKTMLQPSKELPRWMNLVLHVWEGEKKKMKSNVSGLFVLYRTNGILEVYWNGKEFQPHKDGCPSYEWYKANEYAKVLGSHFTDAE